MSFGIFRQAVIPEESAGDGQVAHLAIEHGDRRGGILYKHGKLRLSFLKPRLRGFPIGYIPDECPHRLWTPCRISPQHGSQLDGDDGPILPSVLLLVHIRVAARDDLIADDAFLEGMPTVGGQIPIGQRSHFIRGVAQHLAIDVVEFENPAIHANLHESVAKTLVQHPVTRLGFAQFVLGLFACGYVRRRAEHPDWLAGPIIGGSASIIDPALASIRALNPEFERQVLTFVDRYRAAPTDSIGVVWMNKPVKGFAGAAETRYPQNVEKFLRKRNGIRLGIPFPDASRGHFKRKLKPLGDLRHRALRLRFRTCRLCLCLCRGPLQTVGEKCQRSR